MCFDNTHLQKGAKIAKKNIKVFKALEAVWGNKGIIAYKSPYYRKRWESKQLVTAPVRKTGTPERINQGLHSAKSYDIARSHARHVFNAIVPKGALYWENGYEIVSNQLMITCKKPIIKAL